jgi:hypothetical protein
MRSLQEKVAGPCRATVAPLDFAPLEPLPSSFKADVSGPALVVDQRRLLFRDRRGLRRHFRIQFDERLLIFRNVVLMEDCFDRAFRYARLAIDALIRMDVEHLLPFVEAFDRANHNAIGVFATEARLANDVSHTSISPRAVQTIKAGKR